MIEFAHIKPVSKIKEECVSQKFNKDILLQIKDKKNIIPLNSDTHALFDKHEIYWDSNGKLSFWNKNTVSKELISLDYFECIPRSTLSNISEYLSWYLSEYSKL